MSAPPLRHALYFAPAEAHPLWRAGCDWLGRDCAAEAAAGALADAATAPAAPPPHARDPWRYGFHATLKPPFALRADHSPAELLQAVRALAARHAPFALPPLAVAELDGFLALRPQPGTRCAELHALADDCVRALDGFRAAPGAGELARRLRQPLDDEQRQLLDRWGYPHVLGRWRFHLTLTDRLPADDPHTRQRLLAAAQAHFAAALAVPLACDAVCVFVEPAPGAPFRLAQRIALG
ncbi:DUF1045 domain-containing protein [Derxia lacustris]|uniref:DUF1045 domain-containing protein n=1 Tax=Derxia lacustris TaxID=764842 RepID=UPI000A1728E2|nr:DUF1045 domain-containing protein [Derxia lacustris]